MLQESGVNFQLNILFRNDGYRSAMLGFYCDADVVSSNIVNLLLRLRGVADPAGFALCPPILSFDCFLQTHVFLGLPTGAFLSTTNLIHAFP